MNQTKRTVYLTRTHEELLTAIADEAAGLPPEVWQGTFTLDPDSRAVSEELEQMGYVVLQTPAEDRWFDLRLTEKGIAVAKGLAAARAHMEALVCVGRIH